MKKGFQLAVGLALVISLSSGYASETELEVAGQLRVRGEFGDLSFDTAVASSSIQVMRTRVNVTAVKDSNATAFIQFQDSRVLGGKDAFGNWQSGGLNDGEGVDIHQAYLQIDKVWFDWLGSKVGRFEVNLGNQRLFGGVGWHNVGRAWEGGMAWYKKNDFRLTGFSLVAQEENATDFDRDFNVYGLHANFGCQNLELLGVYEHDKDTTHVINTSDNDLDRLTFGLYAKRTFNQMDAEVNGAIQTGKMADMFDISAFMFTGEVGLNFEGNKKGRLAAGIDFSSGDNTLADSTWGTFNNLYYTGHKFRGYMDYFISSSISGLMDIMVRGEYSFHPKWIIKGDFHYFKTAKEYQDPADGALTSDVGMEFDFTLATTSVAGVTFSHGFSVFLPQESYVRLQLLDADMTETEARFWSYGQATINF